MMLIQVHKQENPLNTQKIKTNPGHVFDQESQNPFRDPKNQGKPNWLI